MDFGFSEEQTTVRELAREILDSEVTLDRIKAVEAAPAWCDRELWSQLAEANLLGIAVPEVHGGMGMGFAELCVLLVELGRSVVPLPAVETLVGALAIERFGTDAQRGTWLPRSAAGEAVFGVAHAEPGARPAIVARAEAGGFVLEGVAHEVTHAGSAARVLLAASGETGPRVVLLDPAAAGVEAVTGRSSTGQPVSELRLTGVRVTESELLGAEGEGAAVAEWLEQHTAAALCALEVGVLERALEITAAYVTEREQFGTPIGSFQAVQHRCADMYIDLEAVRWTTWRAIWKLADGRPAARDVQVAKFWVADAGARIAGAGVHLHGGLGSDVDYPIHRHFLWSKALELRGGGAAAQLAALGRDMARTGPQETA